MKSSHGQRTKLADTVTRIGLILVCAIFSGGIASAFAEEPRSAGPIQVDDAYFHADTDGLNADGKSKPRLPGTAASTAPAGALKVFMHNRGTVPVAVEAVALGGIPLAKLREEPRHNVIWWRTCPDPIPAGAYGEVTVRLRNPIEVDAFLSLRAGQQKIDAAISRRPPSFRIETVAWQDRGQEVTLVARQYASEQADSGQASPIEKVLWDGLDVTSQSRILAPRFFAGICPVVMHLPTALPSGSYHTYKLVAADGQAAACTLRTLEDFLRLDVFGAADLDKDVKLGINSLTHFGPRDRSELDIYAQYGLRTAFPAGQDPPRDIRGHAALYAYYVDEPDVWDYSAMWPEPLRIGYHAPELAAQFAKLAAADPARPAWLNLDMTYTPDNYYVYGHLADIVGLDNYALTIGQSLGSFRQSAEFCRHAAGPHRMEVVAQVNWEDRGPNMKFPRPPFAPEVRIQFLYGLGSGARGFSGYEWYDEGNHHGAKGYPDVLQAIGQTYRSFELVAPLILQAHPTNLATCDDRDVWLKTLVCGADAVLMVAVNDNYQSLPRDFVQTPKRHVAIRLPAIPWLKSVQAARVGDGAFSPLIIMPDGQNSTIVLPELSTGELILVTDDPQQMERLRSRYAMLQQESALRLLQTARMEHDQAARRAEAMRRITGHYREFGVSACARLNSYGVQAPDLWNPAAEQYNGIEWETQSTPRGGQWKVTIPPDRAGMEHVVYFQMERWYGEGHLHVALTDKAGKVLFEQVRPQWSGLIPHFTISFPTAGQYTIQLDQAGKGKPGGRLSSWIFVVPRTAPGLSAAEMGGGK